MSFLSAITKRANRPKLTKAQRESRRLRKLEAKVKREEVKARLKTVSAESKVKQYTAEQKLREAKRAKTDAERRLIEARYAKIGSALSPVSAAMRGAVRGGAKLVKTASKASKKRKSVSLHKALYG